MTKLTRISQTPAGTLEVVTGGRCLMATPATADGPTFEAYLDDAEAAGLMADPGLAVHFAAQVLDETPPKKTRATVAADKPAQE